MNKTITLLAVIALILIVSVTLLLPHPPKDTASQSEATSTEETDVIETIPVEMTDVIETIPVEMTDVIETIPVEDTEAPEPTGLIPDTLAMLERQKSITADIINETSTGGYSFDDPLIILDPYEASPLSALICFQTEQPSQISITIKGKDELTDVNYNFDHPSSSHILPVYGLYPDSINIVTLTMTSSDGTNQTKTHEIKTEPLPKDLENLIILTTEFQSGYSDGVNFTYTGRKMAFDRNGDIRWYLSDDPTLVPVEYNYINNRLIYSKGNTFVGTALFFESDRLGRIYAVYYSPYGVHHDISPKPDGNLLIAGSIGETVEDFIYEIDQDTGEIVHQLDLKYVLQRTRKSYDADASGAGWKDWLHNNSIEWTEQENQEKILISGNHQSTIAQLSWPDGRLDWILASPDDWLNRLVPYILTPIGDKFEYTYNQHAAAYLPDYDNNPDTVDIIVFDNGSSRYLHDKELQRRINVNEVTAPDLYSRLVHFRVNQKEMTVEQIWQFGKEYPNHFSRYRGDADLLPTGNILGSFHVEKAPENNVSALATEVDRNGAIIWEAEIFTTSETGNFEYYRTERLPLYNPPDSAYMLDAKVRMLIPEDVVEAAFATPVAEEVVDEG